MDTVEIILMGLWVLQGVAMGIMGNHVMREADRIDHVEGRILDLQKSYECLEKDLSKLRSDVALRFSQAWDNMTNLDNKIAWLGDDVNSLEDKVTPKKPKKPTAKPAKKKAVKK